MSRLSTLASQLVVLLCVLTVGVRCSVIECCTEVDLIGPLYYLLGTSMATVCPTIQTTASDLTHLVLQPTIGSQQATPTGSFSVTPDSAQDLFTFNHVRSNCKGRCENTVCDDPANTLCDQLVFLPTVLSITSISGEFIVLYSDDSVAINTSVRYSQPAIFYNGDSPPQISGGETLSFIYYFFFENNGRMISVCEEASNGLVSTSDVLAMRRVNIIDENCIQAFGPGRLTRVSNVRIQLIDPDQEINEIRAIFVTPDTCDTAVPENVVNVTIGTPTTMNNTAITTAATTMDPSTTSMVTTTSLPPEPATTTIIIIATCVGVVVIIIFIIVIVIIVVRWKRKGSVPISPDPPNNDQTAVVELKKITEHEKDLDTKEISSISYSSDTVSRAAFVTSSEEPNYKKLEEEILTQHNWDRAHPVASSENGTPTFDDYWTWIAKLLKKGDCVVYIIWNGALETVDDSQAPPIAKLVRSLKNRPLNIQDGRGSHSVMHRLVFLQLGAKGTVDHQDSHLHSKEAFWEVSVEDVCFNPRKCASTVCKIVTAHLEAMETTTRSTENSRYTRTENYYGNTAKAKPVEDVDSSDPSNLSKLFGTFEASINKKLEKNHAEVIQKVQGVDEKVQGVDDKVQGVDEKVQGVDEKVGTVHELLDEQRIMN